MEKLPTRDRTQDIKAELAELKSSLKMTVRKAIRVGELLSEQKDYVGHGLFLNWLEANLDIGQVTAHKYMNLYKHQSKISLSENLSEAYAQIDTLERQEKLARDMKDMERIEEFKATGVKPPGWDRTLDYRMKKDAEDAEKKKKYTLNKDETYDKEEEEDRIENEALGVAAASVQEQNDKRSEWKERIRLSDQGQRDAFVDAVIDYIDTLPDDNRRIEALNNIIKACRNLSVMLQKHQKVA